MLASSVKHIKEYIRMKDKVRIKEKQTSSSSLEKVEVTSLFFHPFPSFGGGEFHSGVGRELLRFPVVGGWFAVGAKHDGV